MEDHNQMKMMAYYKRMLIATVPLGCRPGHATRLKLTASAFFEVAVAAAAEGNLDAAQKAMTSGRAALDSMGRITEGVADAHTRNSWGMAARQRVDAAFARWEADAPVRAAAAAAAEEERTRWAAQKARNAAAEAARKETAEAAVEAARKETAEAAARVALREELTAVFTAGAINPFDSPMLESAAPSSKNNPFDDF
jgi:hypothetical protein